MDQVKTEGQTTSNENTEEKHDNANFECNICLDVAHDAVISLCGHLFWYVIFTVFLFLLHYLYTCINYICDIIYSM